MTRLGWISAILFAVQAIFFGISIADFSRFASVNHELAEECSYRWGQKSQTPDDNQRLNCLSSYWKAEDDNKSKGTYCWIGLALGSLLTLAGVWKGQRDA